MLTVKFKHINEDWFITPPFNVVQWPWGCAKEGVNTDQHLATLYLKIVYVDIASL